MQAERAFRTSFERVVARILAKRKGSAMVYEVTLRAPAINEVVVTSADSEEQAIERAVYSALQRQLKAGEATAKVIALPGETTA